MSENQRLIADRYQVGELIGRGGMADVYEGVDTRLGRVIAIKLLKTDLAADPNFDSRFRQEAQSSARMAHPTIVRVYDTGEDVTVDNYGNEQRRPFIVMEFVRGTVLRDLMHQRRLTVEESIEYAEGVLTALEISHRAGLVHRDIKSANIMITETGQVKVMDFGIARVVSSNTATQAHTSGIVGTAQYFSPEQARGEIVDFRSDLYSTGVLLYEMLAGQPPFKGETAVSVAYQHVSEAVVAPSAHNALISAELDEVVLRALAKNKDGRYQSAEQFREHLLAAAGVARENTVAADVPLQVIEDEDADPLSDFEALLRGDSTPEVNQPEPELTSNDFNSAPPAKPKKPAKPAKPQKASGRSLRDSAPLLAQKRAADNPFSALGVEFDDAPEPVLTKSGRERSAAAPSTSVLIGFGSALLVILIGLGAWFSFNGGISFNIVPTAISIQVADVVGEEFEAGSAELVAQNLTVTKVFENSDTVAVNQIISTDPPAGTAVGPKTSIKIVVSAGRAQVEVPKLQGLKDSAAKSLIESLNLILGNVTISTSPTAKAGVVTGSDPVPGTLLSTGSKVNITVSNGKINVPDVRGMTISAAQAKVASAEFKMKYSVDTASPCSGTKGTTVLDQSPLPGLAPQGSAIVLYVACN